jgi:ribose transport system substrate-binding protein
MGKIEKLTYTIGSVLFLICGAFSIRYLYQISAYTTTQAESPPYRYHIVLVPEELDNEYWRLVEKGAITAAKDRGVFLDYIGPGQANIDEHLKIIEMAAASKVDGIITQGLIDEKFTPLINGVIAKDIPVITIDTDASNSNRNLYIGTDNYYSGFLAGNALKEDTKGHAMVGIVTGDLQTNHQQLRVKGFMDAIQKEKGIQVIAVEESKITRVGAAEKALKILKDHPEVNAFYGTSALDGIGIAQVIESFQEKPYVIGFDTLPETMEYIEKGIIKATVVQKPYDMGYQSVSMMVDLIEGKDTPSLVHTGTKVIRKTDISVPLEEVQ